MATQPFKLFKPVYLVLYMNRETGYYFVTTSEISGVNTKGEYLIGFWDEEDKDWMLPGISFLFYDKDFTEINEERITPPNN